MYRHIYFIYAHTNRYTHREKCQLLLKNRLRSPSFKKTKTEISQGVVTLYFIREQVVALYLKPCFFHTL